MTEARAREDKPYLDARDYLQDAMALLSLKLHREVMMTRALRGDDRQESFLGLFITEQDIGAILAELHGRMIEDFPDGKLLQQRIDTLSRDMAQRLAATTEALPHQQLAHGFQLSDAEIELLMLSLAPEVDSRFGKVYGFLHDDVVRKKPSGALAQQLSGGAATDSSLLRRSLHPDSALMRFRLLNLLDDDNTPLLARGIKLDDRIVDFLLGIRQVDCELAEMLQTPWSGAVTLRRDDCIDSAVESAQLWQRQMMPLLLEARPEADVDVWFSLFCSHSKMSLLCLDWQKLTQLDYGPAARLLAKAVREGHLSNSLLHLRGVDDTRPRLLTRLAALATPLVCISQPPGSPTVPLSLPILEIRVPGLSLENRQACWKAALPGSVRLDDKILREYAQRYPIGVETMEQLCRNLGISNNHGDFQDQLSQACRRHVGGKMHDVAQRVETSFRFSDIVLPGATLVSLQELVERQANTSLVFNEWGFTDLFQQSPGSSALFMGPSGTGKTMAASIIANELGLDMYRVDLSGVVSKYIGETEKNLERIFTTAARSEVVLFIDEADALFGKRSEVKDAHDRYANIEVSYLLQKMEDHNGVVILASNFGQNIDDAFFRRFSTVVEFTLPNSSERLQLWEKLGRARAPLADNLDLEFLAERFEITGGHIKNCILMAAFQAAASQQPINMLMLIRAISKEYAKIGRPISKGNFGDYYAALRRETAGA